MTNSQYNDAPEPGSSIKERWAAALPDELTFWDEVLRTRGGRWPEEFATRLDPELPLQTNLTRLLPHGPGRIDILDVGSGPLTMIGKKWGDHPIYLTATDALAHEYDKMLKKYSIVPLVKSVRCEAEMLLSIFPEKSFDLAHARNCLDHAYNPVEAIRQMIKCVKRNRFIFLSHGTNEAEKASYRGLHQWNFDVQEGDFVIWNRSEKISVAALFQDIAELQYAGARDGWCEVQIRRRG